ncbi:MAG: GAF domain-containing protein [Chloroflexi bacterium]|nr:GAF domain-containing protein [Chloroflexota bacterium]
MKRTQFPFLTFKSIRTQLITAFIIAVLLPAVVIISVTGVRDVRNEIDNTESQLNAATALKSAQVDIWLNDQKDEISRVLTDESSLELVELGLPDSALVSLREETRSRLAQRLSSALQLTRDMDALFVMDLQGTVFVASDEKLMDTSFSELPFLGDVTTRSYVAPLRYSTEQKSAELFFFYPLVLDGEIIAIVGGRAPMTRLDEFMLERAGLGETGETYLVDTNHVLLTPSRFSGYLVGDTVETEPTRKVFETQVIETGEYEGYRGETVIGSYRWLSELEVVLAVEQERAEVLRPTLTTLGVNVLVAVLAVLFFGMTSLFFVDRGISRPLATLSENAIQIAGGNLSLKNSIKADNEIGTLAQSFNKMSDQLSDLFQNLENRVAARTHELQIAADVSKQSTTVLDIDTLLNEVVSLTATGFRLYSTTIYLLDNEKHYLLNAASSLKESTTKAIQRGHMIELDAQPSIIAEASRTGKAVLVNNIADSPLYLADPALPQTKSELAIPMMVGSQLLGVFDLQSDQAERFRGEDVRVMTSLAEQIAIAVRNAELFAEKEVALQEAERASKIKSQFLAAMSHELRTPLNAILNFSQFVSSGMLGTVNDEQVDVLNKITASGKHLLGLINDVLDISKIESGALTLFVEEKVNLASELQAVEATGRTLLQDKPVELKIEIENDLPVVVGDRRRIRQIMLNLVSNACKFTEAGEVNIQMRRHGMEEVLFSVKDTGPGIAPEDFEAVFETFRQTEAGLRQSEGTGLGLPISRRLVEAHGGHLFLESVLGQGSTFSFVLPIRSPQLLQMIRTSEKGKE